MLCGVVLELATERSRGSQNREGVELGVAFDLVELYRVAGLTAVRGIVEVLA